MTRAFIRIHFLVMSSLQFEISSDHRKAHVSHDPVDHFAIYFLCNYRLISYIYLRVSINLDLLYLKFVTEEVFLTKISFLIRILLRIFCLVRNISVYFSSKKIILYI